MVQVQQQYYDFVRVYIQGRTCPRNLSTILLARCGCCSLPLHLSLTRVQAVMYAQPHAMNNANHSCAMRFQLQSNLKQAGAAERTCPLWRDCRHHTGEKKSGRASDDHTHRERERERQRERQRDREKEPEALTFAAGSAASAALGGARGGTAGCTPRRKLSPPERRTAEVERIRL